MAAWKGNSRWIDDEDDALDPDYRESSDDDDEEDVPKKLSVMRARWIEENVDELQELMSAFCDAGTKLFGRAFFQVGTINNFGNFCFKYMTPGAV